MGTGDIMNRVVLDPAGRELSLLRGSDEWLLRCISRCVTQARCWVTVHGRHVCTGWVGQKACWCLLRIGDRQKWGHRKTGEYNKGSPIKRSLGKGEHRVTAGWNCHFGKEERTVDMLEVEMLARWWRNDMLPEGNQTKIYLKSWFSNALYVTKNPATQNKNSYSIFILELSV